jgi:hypothetical protein
MFVQIITAHTSDPEGLRRQGERWSAEVRPGAIGFLGGTVGTAADGTTVAVVRFADEASARANSERPEQHAWWEETAAYYDVEPIVRESSDIELVFGGGSDDAGFVQVIEGTLKDRARLEELMTTELEAQVRASRPDIIGGIRMWLPHGAFVEVAYFTSQADAREGESSDEFADAHDEIATLYDGLTFVDLTEPTLIEPSS